MWEVSARAPVLELGLVDVTPDAQRALEAAKESADEYLARHMSGDWGELGHAAWNDRPLRDGFRIFSAYILRTGVKISIFTEADRSVTMVSLPEEH